MAVRHSTDSQDIVERFSILLDAVHAAGFQDFDQMVAEYYTGQFTTNSLLDERVSDKDVLYYLSKR